MVQLFWHQKTLFLKNRLAQIQYMKYLFLFLLLVSCKPTTDFAPKIRVFDNEKANWGFSMESFQIAFLTKPAVPHLVPPDSIPILQANHLTRLSEIYQAGHSLSYGPFDGDSLENLRGIVIFPGSTPVDSIEKWLGTDPYIHRGVMDLKVLKWWTGDSLLYFADRRAKR
jgi:uncharacterized protein YciI